MASLGVKPESQDGTPFLQPDEEGAVLEGAGGILAIQASFKLGPGQLCDFGLCNNRAGAK